MVSKFSMHLTLHNKSVLASTFELMGASLIYSIIKGEIGKQLPALYFVVDPSTIS